MSNNLIPESVLTTPPHEVYENFEPYRQRASVNYNNTVYKTERLYAMSIRNNEYILFQSFYIHKNGIYYDSKVIFRLKGAHFLTYIKGDRIPGPLVEIFPQALAQLIVSYCTPQWIVEAHHEMMCLLERYDSNLPLVKVLSSPGFLAEFFYVDTAFLPVTSNECLWNPREPNWGQAFDFDFTTIKSPLIPESRFTACCDALDKGFGLSRHPLNQSHYTEFNRFALCQKLYAIHVREKTHIVFQVLDKPSGNGNIRDCKVLFRIKENSSLAAIATIRENLPRLLREIFQQVLTPQNLVLDYFGDVHNEAYLLMLNFLFLHHAKNQKGVPVFDLSETLSSTHFLRDFWDTFTDHGLIPVTLVKWCGGANIFEYAFGHDGKMHRMGFEL